MGQATGQLFLGHAALWPPHPWSSWRPHSVSCPGSAPLGLARTGRGWRPSRPPLASPHHSGFGLRAKGQPLWAKGPQRCPGPCCRASHPGGAWRQQALEQRLGLGCPRRCEGQHPGLPHSSTQCVPAAPRAAGRPARGQEDVLPGSTRECLVASSIQRQKGADLGSDSSLRLGVVPGKRRQKVGGQEPSSAESGLSSAPILGQEPLPTVGHCPLLVTWDKGPPWGGLRIRWTCAPSAAVLPTPSHSHTPGGPSKPGVGLRSAGACRESS